MKTIAYDSMTCTSMVPLSAVVRIVPFQPAYNEECSALMMHCIREIKQRAFNPEHDDDMLDLEGYYTPNDSVLLVALASITEHQREKVVGTLGIKCEGVVDGKKCAMIRRLYIEPEYRVQALLPLFHAMRTHVVTQQFEKLRFTARQKIQSTFDAYKKIAAHVGMKEQAFANGDVLYTWDLPKKNGQLTGKLCRTNSSQQE